MAEELSHAEEKFGLEQSLLQARTSAAESAARLADARATFEGQQEAAKAKKIDIETRAGIIEDALKPGLTEAEARETIREITPLLIEAGSPIVPGGPLEDAYTIQLLNQSQSLEGERAIEEKKAESFRLFREIQAETGRRGVELRERTTATPEEEAKIEAIQGQIETAQSQLVLAGLKSESRRPERAAQGQADVERLTREIDTLIGKLDKVRTKNIQQRQQRAAAPPPPGATAAPTPGFVDPITGETFKGGPPVPGFPDGDPNDSDNWENP
jgi:hypothetical protein